jgi:HPt (histidine-containing phosphotransfer) domain-containing protein
MITDLNYLRTMSGGDDKFIAEMIELFREQVDEYSSMMPALLEAKDYSNLSKLAHKAKSSVAVMGMTAVSDLLRDLELLANEEREVERFGDMISEFLEQSKLAILELEQQIR